MCNTYFSNYYIFFALSVDGNTNGLQKSVYPEQIGLKNDEFSNDK